MRKFIKISFLLVMFAFVASSTQAQKFGYVDSDVIISNLPKYQQAIANLKVFEQQLTSQGENMVKDLQTKAAMLEDRRAKGTITQKDFETEAKKLQEQELKIRDYQAKAAKQFQDKEKQELQPISDDVNAAIKAVAKENGFQFIFEKKMLLYFDDVLDVSSQVTAKLK